MQRNPNSISDRATARMLSKSEANLTSSTQEASNPCHDMRQAPAMGVGLMRHQDAMIRNQTHANVIERCKQVLSDRCTALRHISEVLDAVMNVGVICDNETTPNKPDTQAPIVSQYLEQLLGLLNNKSGTCFLFGGTKKFPDGEQPFTATRVASNIQSVSYGGNQLGNKVPIGPNASIDYYGTNPCVDGTSFSDALINMMTHIIVLKQALADTDYPSIKSSCRVLQDDQKNITNDINYTGTKLTIIQESHGQAEIAQRRAQSAIEGVVTPGATQYRLASQANNDHKRNIELARAQDRSQGHSLLTTH